MAFQQTATEIVQSTNKEVADARGHSVVVVLIQELEQPCGESLLLIVRVDNIVPHAFPLFLFYRLSHRRSSGR